MANGVLNTERYVRVGPFYIDNGWKVWKTFDRVNSVWLDGGFGTKKANLVEVAVRENQTRKRHPLLNLLLG